MTNTAEITKAIEILAARIEVVGIKYQALHRAMLTKNEVGIERMERSRNRSQEAYYTMLAAYSMLFDIDLDQLEHMTLASMGCEYVNCAESYWSRVMFS